MKVSNILKEKIRQAILEGRENFGGSDSSYAKKLGINNSVYSRLKNGEIENIIADSTWLQLGREFDVTLNEQKWKIARTSVYNEIEDNLKFCKKFSKSMILVDEAGIGKTECAKHIVKTMKNGFYLDCSQAKTRIQFTKALAKEIGTDSRGKFYDIKENVKYGLKILDRPCIVLDEVGDLDYGAFLDIKEFWNSSAGNVGWYMMGADGLQAKIEKRIDSKKVGYAEILSRFNDDFIKLVPRDKFERQQFLIQLVGDIASVNVDVKEKVQPIVKNIISKGSTMRAIETIIQLSA